MKLVLRVAAAAMFATSTAGAQTLLVDTFDAENGGSTALNYASFTNWIVNGTVDVVRNGDFGIQCFGNTGSCVDLDGSQDTAGKLVSNTSFSFNAGDLVGISFMASGSQRGSASDLLQFMLNFSGSTTFSSYAGNFGGALTSGGTLAVGTGYVGQNSLAGTSAWAPWTFQFIAANSGSFILSIGTTSADNVGPLIDDVSVGVSSVNNVVPEPSTWALMLGGLGVLGLAARRRRAA